MFYLTFFVSVEEKLHSNFPSSKLAIAVCAQVKVKANSKEKIEFSLVWHMPEIYFGDRKQMYKRLVSGKKARKNYVFIF